MIVKWYTRSCDLNLNLWIVFCGLSGLTRDELSIGKPRVIAENAWINWNGVKSIYG